MIGNRNKTYNEAINNCCNEPLISLSRDNITSNAMKINLEGNNLDRKLIEKLKEIDSNTQRKNIIVSLIKAIELAKNTKYKDALKIINSIYKNKNNPQKTALYSLLNMINNYEEYSNGTLMDFYNVACRFLDFKISGFNKGK